MKSKISEHISNVFSERELEETSTVRNFRTVATNGKTYDLLYYNLDAIIAVGYRLNSARATKFRIWATNTLKEYIIKGFDLEEELLGKSKELAGIPLASGKAA
ncbi:MAG: virulence RhuM family protein [Acidobacteria bacterium]|nr:virulence RhuM family protein [Acidobacteriota bacterium]